jgi:hypothetical protein
MVFVLLMREKAWSLYETHGLCVKYLEISYVHAWKLYDEYNSRKIIQLYAWKVYCNIWTKLYVCCTQSVLNNLVFITKMFVTQL